MANLCLSLFPEERVVIGDPLKPLGVVKLVRVKGEKASLLFEFPRDVTINRGKVADEIVAKSTPSKMNP